MANQDRSPQPRELAHLQELLERVGTEEDRITTLVRGAAVDRELFTDLLDLYQQKAGQVVTKDVFYPYEQVTGEVGLGADPDGRPIGLTRDQLNEHLLVVGKTGSGKTTFFYNLMETCGALDVPFMIFDFKNDYRHLVDRHDLLVLNWRDVKFNPFQPPPGVSQAMWGEVIGDTFAHATDLLIGSESYFLRKLYDLYALYGEETDQYPSVFELYDLVAADQLSPASPKFRYKERIENRLGAMTGFSGEIFDCSRGIPLDELLDRNVVFELKEPNRDVSNFVIEAILTWIYYYRDAIGHRQTLRHLVLFDEAKHVFDVNRERQPESGFPPIDDLMGQIREFGEALVVADHEPSKLTDSLKANTTAKLWLTLGNGKDITEMARTFGLDREETDYTRTMTKGEGLFKLADAEPVPIRLPDYPLQKTVTEAEIRNRMIPEVDALGWEERYRPRRFQQAIGARPEPPDDDTPVGEVAEALLASVNDKPFLGMAERYDVIDVGSKVGTAAKAELVKLGLVREVDVRTGTPGRNPKLLELTPASRRVLKDRGHAVAGTGRRGIEHRYWQDRIKTYHERRGFTAETEYAVGNQRIDVYAASDDETIGVEVARSPEHEVENIEKCLDHGVDRVQVTYLDEEVKTRIERAVHEVFGEIPDRVEFVPVSTYT